MKIPHPPLPPRSQFFPRGSGEHQTPGWRDQHILVVSGRTSGWISSSASSCDASERLYGGGRHG